MNKFACAQTGYDSAEYVILGVPFDKTSSFRPGAADGPEEVRRASYCFEPYMMEYDISLSDMYIHDKGNLSEHDDVEDMGDELRSVVTDIMEKNKFPIVIGGEHSLSPYAVSAFEDVHVIILDAHLDYRDTYEGLKRSHATPTRRISELPIRGLNVLGVRSLSQDVSMIERPPYLTSQDILKNPDVIDEICEKINGERVYLSIDMDVFDPSYAPGVGNPEPYGLEPIVCKRIIGKLSDHLVGVDIVETCPHFDHGGITSNLAARLIYDVIGSKAAAD